jgi:hypothetical protein
MTITLQQCDTILSRDLKDCEAAVNRAVEAAISQNAFDACVSLAFNIGAPGFVGSTVVREINADNMQAAADAFLLWDHPPELLGRRKGEKAQFLRPDNPADNSEALESPPGSISWIQSRLNAKGAKPILAVDGDLGPATTGAIRAFQTAQGLSPTGLADPETIAALG